MSGPFEAPRANLDLRPKVITLFRAYAAVNAATYAGAAVFVLATTARSVLLAAAMIGFAMVHVIAALVPYRPWGWTLALVTMGLGLASPAFLLALPLVLAWSKPLVRASFGRPP